MFRLPMANVRVRIPFVGGAFGGKSYFKIEPLAVGAWILGTGGGGSPYASFLNLRRLYEEGARVEVMDPDDLADDDLVAVVSNQGAPLVGQERLSDPDFAAKPVRMMPFSLSWSAPSPGCRWSTPMPWAGPFRRPR